MLLNSLVEMTCETNVEVQFYEVETMNLIQVK